jgi:nicotinamide-nucleotide amidase
MKSEIIAVGSEMLTPFRQDTNSLYLTEKLNEIGVTVAFKTIVGDRKKDLVSAVRTALARADIVAVMGGLGPTEDDLTREAVAEALGVTIRRDPNSSPPSPPASPPGACTMTDNNLKQADVIEGATVLPTPTAPPPANGSTPPSPAIASSSCSSPARPKSASRSSTTNASPPARNPARPPHRQAHPQSRHDSRVAGRRLLAPIYTTYTDVETTILAGNAEIQLSSSAPNPPSKPPSSASTSSPASSKSPRQTLFSSSDETLEQIVLYYLGSPGDPRRRRKLHRRPARPAHHLHQRQLALLPRRRRRLFQRAQDTIRRRPPELIAEHGAVSAEVAEALAQGIRPHRRQHRRRHHRHRRPHRRHRRKARRPRLHRSQLRQQNRVAGMQLPRRPRPNPPLGQPASPGPGPPPAHYRGHHLPLLVDIDTGWGSAFNIARTIRSMQRAGAAACTWKTRWGSKRCGHRPGKELVPAARDGRSHQGRGGRPHRSGICHHGSYRRSGRRGSEAALDRVAAYVAAGADMIFAEAVTDLAMYPRSSKPGVPILANITEFGQTPLYTAQRAGRGRGGHCALLLLRLPRHECRCAEGVPCHP